MKKVYLLVFLILLVSLSGCSSYVNVAKDDKKIGYSYDGSMGPYSWGKESKTCDLGKEQSPINIISNKRANLDSKNILDFNGIFKLISLKVINTKSAIKVIPRKSSSITINGEIYKLLQFHFHGRSENLIDGKRFAMEMHLVHKNDKNELAVVGVMIEEGNYNDAFGKIVNSVNGKNINLTIASLLPKNLRSYYHFAGSLTTPPCSENVKWYVLKNIITLSKKQIIAFRTFHNYNYRPVQELNDRIIKSR